MDQVNNLANLLISHEEKFNNSFSMVPSENPISPLAKRVFQYDAYTRYYFDNINQWGTWAFPGGNILGKIEIDILIPLLQELAEAKYVNVKSISGLNCMLTTILSYCKTGDCICLMPFELGGHPSAAEISRNLGLEIIYAPTGKDNFDIDTDKFYITLKKFKPKLIYVDQATVLFPLNIGKIKKIVTNLSLDTRIHVDSSHINGLILGKVLPNPLKEGADSFGGSTHKSLAGPHKAYFVTNDKEIANSYYLKSSYMTSHHHMADLIALTVTLLEFKLKKGNEYASQMVCNAKAFGKALNDFNFKVQGKEFEYTACHRIWLDPSNYMDTVEAAKKLLEIGIIVNTFQKLPYIDKPGFRIGVNEVTTFGLQEREMSILANFYHELIVKKSNVKILAEEVKKLRQKFNVHKFCFTKEEAASLLPLI